MFRPLRAILGWIQLLFLKHLWVVVIVFSWGWPVGAEACCDTERNNNINKISQLRLRVYVWKILTCTLRNRMHATKIKSTYIFRLMRRFRKCIELWMWATTVAKSTFPEFSVSFYEGVSILRRAVVLDIPSHRQQQQQQQQGSLRTDKTPADKRVVMFYVSC
jgi:hypothetical protein